MSLRGLKAGPSRPTPMVSSCVVASHWCGGCWSTTLFDDLVARFRFVFGINYFTQLHGTAIFLALGIGADDIFVFTDA